MDITAPSAKLSIAEELRAPSAYPSLELLESVSSSRLATLRAKLLYRRAQAKPEGSYLRLGYLYRAALKGSCDAMAELAAWTSYKEVRNYYWRNLRSHLQGSRFGRPDEDNNFETGMRILNETPDSGVRSY